LDLQAYFCKCRRGESKHHNQCMYLCLSIAHLLQDLVFRIPLQYQGTRFHKWCGMDKLSLYSSLPESLLFMFFFPQLSSSKGSFRIRFRIDKLESNQDLLPRTLLTHRSFRFHKFWSMASLLLNMLSLELYGYGLQDLRNQVK